MTCCGIILHVVFLIRKVQRGFLQESKLSYKETPEDMVPAAETAAKDTKRIQGHSEEKPSDEAEVHRVSKPTPRRDSSDNACHRCGGKHQLSQCKFNNYICHSCKRRGHIAEVCRAASSSEPKKEQTHRVDDDHSDDEEYKMFQVSSATTQPVVVTVKVNGVNVDIELDTWASMSLINEEKFYQIHTPITLEPSKAKLFTYTKEAIGVAGSTEVKIKHNQQSATLHWL